MKHHAATAVAFALLLSAAAPPPPVLPPQALPRMQDGYDLHQAFAVWAIYVDRQRGPVIEEATRRDLEQSYHVFSLRVIDYDIGHSASAVVRARCASGLGDPNRASGCTYVFRYTHIPVYTWQQGSAIHTWLTRNFDGAEVVGAAQAEGLAPGADFWTSPGVFARLPSPRAVLRDHLRVEDVESATCPAFAEALRRIEVSGLRIELNLPTLRPIGRNTVPPSVPHGASIVYKLSASTASGAIAIETGHGEIADALRPVTGAALQCLQAQRAAATAPQAPVR